MKYLKKYKNYIKENLNPEEIENLKKLISTGNMDDIDLALLIASGHPEIENKVKGFVCEQLEIKNYTINENGFIDVDGDVSLYKRNLSKLPLKFGRVTGNFYCFNNQLTTLEGCPEEVGGDFTCQNNKLTTLEGCPRVVGNDFWCYKNQLTTLESDPDRILEVGGIFWCSSNQLTTLLGCPKEVGGDFWCENNQITIIKDELEFVKIMGNFEIGNNPIHNVYKLFPNFKSFQDSLDYNYFREPNLIVKNRFEEACEEAGIKIPKIIKGYEYI
jgi:hypothetical protein